MCECNVRDWYDCASLGLQVIVSFGVVLYLIHLYLEFRDKSKNVSIKLNTNILCQGSIFSILKINNKSGMDFFVSNALCFMEKIDVITIDLNANHKIGEI